MPGPTIYSVGTASVANGGTTVTGVGTSWVGKVFEGDLFTDPAQGLFARVTADPTSNTSLSINPWPGTALTGDPYEVLLQADSIRSSERTRQLLEELASIDANGRGLFYRFSDSVSDADPGAGYLRLNHATEASATMLYIDGVDANGSDLLALIDTWDDSTSTNKGKLFIRSVEDPSQVVVYNVTAVTTATGYRKVTIAYVDGDGNFAADDQLMVDFARTGDMQAVSAFIATLLDDADAATARTTLGAQPLDSDLTAIAALATQAFGRSLLTAADKAAANALLGGKPIVNITFGSSSTEYTTTNTSSFQSTAGINVTALSTTSSLLVLCQAQMESQRDGTSGFTGAQLRLYRYTGATFVVMDESNIAMALNTDASTARIARDSVMLAGRMTAAQKRTDTPGTPQWNVNPHILNMYAGNTAKLKYHNMVFIEYEPS